MEKVVLKATKRTLTGKQVSQLRRKGQLPAVVYGHNFEPVLIVLDAHESNLTIPRLTPSSIVNIELEGKEIPTLVREKQKNYIKNELIHVDFLAVSLTETIRTEVTIHQHGISPAVKDFNAVLVTNMTTLTVEALPNDLPERIEIDLSKLTTLGSAVHVRDLNLPAAVTVIDDPDEIIVVATATHEETEGEEGESAEPSLSVERGKKEEK